VADLKRIKGIKKNKKIINDTLEQTANFLLIALKNPNSTEMVMSKATMMLEDFNYQYFNPIVLTGPNDELSDIEARFSQKVDTELDIDKEGLAYGLGKVVLGQDEIAKITNLQEQDDLFDLTNLKIEVNSSTAGNLKVLLFIHYRISLNLIT